jgi:hypothetical protein
MRIIPSIVLAVALFVSSYAGTVILPSQSWVTFSPAALYSDASLVVNNDFSFYPSCSPITDSTDFYWAYYDICTCTTPCCPSLGVASKRPFYVSKKVMNYGAYRGNPAKLADTTLFAKCTTSVAFPFYGCPSAMLVSVYNLGIVPGGVDSLSARLFVFQTKGYIYVPLKIDRVVKGVINNYWTGQQYLRYDSIQVTFGNTLTGTAVPAMVTPGSRNALHIATTGAGYVISGFGEGNGRLEIVNAQGKTVYCRTVFSSPAVMGKNIVGPGIYFLRVHSQKGISSIVLPVN